MHRLWPAMAESTSGRNHCPHCDSMLARKTYDAHKRLYYDVETDQWIKKRRLTTDDEYNLLSSTENAMEQLDFDTSCFNLAPSTLDESNNSSQDEAPPIVDFNEMEQNISAGNGEF